MERGRLLRVGLSCSGRPVREHSGVVAVQDSVAEELRGLLEHFHLARVLVEGEVKCILLFSGPVLAKVVVVADHICRVHQNNNLKLRKNSTFLSIIRTISN